MIHQFKPSEAIEFSRNREDVVELLTLGFGQNPDKVDATQIITDEYDHGEDRTMIFLAEVNGKIVGSLYFILWKNEPSDKRGKPLLEYIEANGRGIIDLEALNTRKVLACDLSIVVHPDYRGTGVSGQLFHAGVEAVKPAMLFGQTKTPAAVLARDRAMSGLGYTTFMEVCLLEMKWRYILWVIL